MNKPILIIEDQLLIAKDIQLFLQKNGYHPADIAQKYPQALELFNQNEYQTVICDINLEDEKTGLDVAEAFNQRRMVPIVFLTAFSDIDTIQRAQKLAPFAYLIKPFNYPQLLVTLNLASLNYQKAKQNITLIPDNTEKLQLLSSREKEVLIEVANGRTNKEIAQQLFISVLTVETHRKKIKSKLSLGTTGELINFAFTSHLITIS